MTLQCSLRESCTYLNCIPIIPSHTHVHPTQVVAHSCLKATKPLICIHGVGASVQCFLDLSSVEERMDRGQQDLGPLTSSSMSFSLFLSHMGTSKMDMGFELHQSPVMISDVNLTSWVRSNTTQKHAVKNCTCPLILGFYSLFTAWSSRRNRNA